MDGGQGGSIVVVADGVGDPEEIADALDSERSVRTATSLEAVRSILDDVSCVLTTETLDDAEGLDLVETIREYDPDLPVMFVPRTGSEELAARATAAGATAYVPIDTPDTLRRSVGRAVENFERRVHQRRDSHALRSIIEWFPVTVLVKDEEARHVLLSTPPDGWSHEEVVGKTDLDLYSDGDPEHARQAYEDDLHVLESGEPILEQLERIDGPDYTAWIETTKVPIRDAAGDVCGLVGISIDRTQQKEYEHELVRERARSERFANYIAHDLRNPLNVARGYLDLAREMDDPDPLDDVEAALDRIEEVIDDVLSLVGREREDLPVEQVQFHEPIQNAWETVQTRNATLSVDVPQNALIGAGRSHIQELFENLIRNSVEHAGSSVAVRVGLLPDGFYFEDDGPGIPEDARENVLEYGYTTNESGTGIGLAVVTELADVYSWDVSVTESADGGARFEFHGCLLVPDPPDREPHRKALELEGSTDVGELDPQGATTQEGTGWILRGAGADIWSTQDEFHFAYAPLPGDGGITARVAELEQVDEYTKAGLMIRDAPREGTALGHVGLTAEHGTEVLWRPEETDRTVNIPIDLDAEEPFWFRIERHDDTVTAWISADGDTWVAIDQRRLDLDDTVYAGLVVCSHQSGILAEARFEDVQVYSFEGD